MAGCLQFEQTLYTLLTSSSLSSLSMVSRNSRRIACSCNTNRSGSAIGLGVGFSEDTRSLLLPQERLVFSSSFTHTELSESCWSSSGEAKSGFPANFFSRNRACLFLERANAEGDLFFFRRRFFSGFTVHVVRPVTLLSSLALLGVLAGSLQLTVNENLSWLRVTHQSKLTLKFYLLPILYDQAIRPRVDLFILLKPKIFFRGKMI